MDHYSTLFKILTRDTAWRKAWPIKDAQALVDKLRRKNGEQK